MFFSGFKSIRYRHYYIYILFLSYNVIIVLQLTARTSPTKQNVTAHSDPVVGLCIYSTKEKQTKLGSKRIYILIKKVKFPLTLLRPASTELVTHFTFSNE